MNEIATLRDFVEYDSIYEYTNEYFDINKEFMEMNLITMRMRAYDYLREHDDITYNQLGSIMVESGSDVQPELMEGLFIEKSGGIFSKIGDILKRIGKAMVSLWHRFIGLFKNNNSKLGGIKESAVNIVKNLRGVGTIADAIGTAKAVKDINPMGKMRQAMEQINQVADSLNTAGKRFNGLMATGEMPVDAGFDPEDAIKVVIQQANSLFGNKLSKEAVQLQRALCNDKYTVVGLSIIADLEKIPDMIKEVLIITDENKHFTTDAVYDSAKALHKLGAHWQDKVREVRSAIEKMKTTTKKFTMSEDVLDSKLKAARELAARFEDLANVTAIGRDDPGMSSKMFNRIVLDTDENKFNRDTLMRSMRSHAERDEELKAKRSMIPFRRGMQTSRNISNLMAEMTTYIHVIHDLSRSLHSATSAMIQAISSHMELRNKAITAQGNLQDFLQYAINEASTSQS